MKLNRKGYMLVEIIISSVLAMSIALYLLNLTYDFKNLNNDIYQSVTYTSDKIAITKNIMNDLDQVIVTNFRDINQNDKKNIIIEFYVKSKQNDNPDELRRLKIEQNEKGEHVITYGKVDETTNNFIKEDISYYQKTLEKSLMINTEKIHVSERQEESRYIQIIIPVESMYEDRNYDIKLLLNKNKNAKLNGSFKVVYHLTTGNRGTMAESTHFYNVSSKLNKNNFKKEYMISFDDSYTDCYTCSCWSDGEEDDDLIIHENNIIEDDSTNLDEDIILGDDTIFEDDCYILGSPDNHPSSFKEQYEQKTITFKGWSDTENGGVVFSDEASINIKDKLENDVLNLYAVWEENESIKLPEAQPPADNYIFNGWHLNNKKIGNSGDDWVPTNEDIKEDIKIKGIYIDISDGEGSCCNP